MEDLLKNDDITDSMTADDFQRLESEAWKKAEVLEKNSGSENMKRNNNITCLDLTKDNITCNSTTSNTVRSIASQRTSLPKQQVSDKFQASCSTKQDPEIQQLASQLEKYKLKVQELENSLCMKDGQLKVITQSLDARRREVNEKENLITQIRKEQVEERSERNCKSAQEIKRLRTQLSFQKHELMKLETNRLQSQKESNSQNMSNNSQKVPASQKVSGSVKRKVSSTSHGFDLDNSFHGSQISCGNIPQGKIPRLERKVDDRNEMKTSLTCKPSKIDQPKETKSLTSCKKNQSSVEKASTAMTSAKTRETTSSKPTEMNTSTAQNSRSSNHLLEPRIGNLLEKKACNLVKKLVLSCELNDGSEDFETMSLLTLLKYPLKCLSDVLKAHSVNTNTDQSLSQFPIWQTQVQSDSDDLSTDEDFDFDSGKYNLVSQGMFLLLGLSNLTEKSVDTLGVIHVLVFLELYITSYLLTRTDEHDNKSVMDPRNVHQGVSTKKDTEGSEGQKTSFDEQDMILQTLQFLKLLFYSTPGLVKCVLDRTSPALFKQEATDEDLVVIYDSNVATEGILKEDENCKVFEENGTVGTFRSLLLKNFLKLLVPCSGDNSSFLVYNATLEVLIAITTLSNTTQLESIFIPLNNGCLVELLSKDDCTISTVSLVMVLIRNFRSCKDVHKMLCSHTDDCILLKIYQWACNEENDGAEDWRKFLLQFFQFLMKIAFSHDDSIEFLLESDCQCSFEVIRCLVLVLYDKVKYLVDLDTTEQIRSDESLPIVRTGINILVILCTHPSYSPSDHKLHVEHEFSELIYKSMNLFKNIRPYMPEHEALALQDLLDMETIDEIEWSSGSEDNDDDDMLFD